MIFSKNLFSILLILTICLQIFQVEARGRGGSRGGSRGSSSRGGSRGGSWFSSSSKSSSSKSSSGNKKSSWFSFGSSKSKNKKPNPGPTYPKQKPPSSSYPKQKPPAYGSPPSYNQAKYGSQGISSPPPSYNSVYNTNKNSFSSKQPFSYGGKTYSNNNMAGIMTMSAMNRGGFRKPYGYTSGYTPGAYGYGYNSMGYNNYLKNSYGKSSSGFMGTGIKKSTAYKLGGAYLGYKAAKGAGKMMTRAYMYSLYRPYYGMGYGMGGYGTSYHSRWWYWLNDDYIYRGKLSPYCDIWYDRDSYREILRCDRGYYFNYDYMSPGGRYYDAYYNPNNPNRKNWDEICTRFFAPESNPDASENIDMEAFKKLNDAAKDTIDENVPVNATDSSTPELGNVGAETDEETRLATETPKEIKNISPVKDLSEEEQCKAMFKTEPDDYKIEQDQWKLRSQMTDREWRDFQRQSSQWADGAADVAVGVAKFIMWTILICCCCACFIGYSCYSNYIKKQRNRSNSSSSHHDEQPENTCPPAPGTIIPGSEQQPMMYMSEMQPMQQPYGMQPAMTTPAAPGYPMTTPAAPGYPIVQQDGVAPYPVAGAPYPVAGQTGFQQPAASAPPPAY